MPNRVSDYLSDLKFTWPCRFCLVFFFLSFLLCKDLVYLLLYLFKPIGLINSIRFVALVLSRKAEQIVLTL